MSRLPALLLVALLGVSACTAPARDPLQLDGNMLTVENQTADEWRNIEIWLNRYYRAVAPSLAAGGRLQVQLDMFVSGYAQRFDFRRAQITDLRLTARKTNGETIEVVKNFRSSNPLNEALEKH